MQIVMKSVPVSWSDFNRLEVELSPAGIAEIIVPTEDEFNF